MCLNPGDIISERYQIVYQLGSGGSARTYLANDLNLPDRPRRVVKEIKPWSNDPPILRDVEVRFNREAEALHLLGQCDRVPTLFESFQKNSRFYIIQEYISGRLLSQELTGDGQWSEAEVIELLKDILEVLKVVHKQNIIHRDLKPSNLIRRKQDGKIALIDFGIVKEIGNSTASAPGQEKRTKAYGTEGYMPIEQAMGYPQLCSDIYAVGIIAIQALTGLNPPLQTDKNGEILGRIWASQVSSRLAEILDKMVHHDYKKRYESAADVLQALNRLPTSVEQKALQKKSTIWQLLSKLTLGINSWNRTSKIALSVMIVVASIALVKLAEIKIFVSNNFAKTSAAPTLVPAVNSNISLRDRMSFGDKILLKNSEISAKNPRYQKFIAAKESGVKAMATDNYEQAVSHFENAIKKYPNAPETLIYLNNARIAKKQKQVYTIAVVVPIGKEVERALEILRGVAQAQKEINEKGGINGRRLKVIIVNDDDNQGIAQQIASELVKNSEVLGVIGHYSSDVTGAVGKKYEAGKLVTISPTSTSFKLSDFNPYVFRTVPNDAIAARKLADYMRKTLKLQKAAVFFNTKSEYSKSLKHKFIEEVVASSGEVDNELQFDLSNDSFRASESVNKAIERKAEVIMLASNLGVLDQALLVAQQANQKNLKLLGGDGVYSPKTLANGGEAAVGMVLAVAWHPNAALKSSFFVKSQQLWGGRVNWRTAMSYDATQALIEAIKRNPSRPGVQQALSAPNFSATGASGEVRFSSSRDRIGTVQLVEVCRNQNTETGYDFVLVGRNCKV